MKPSEKDIRNLWKKVILHCRKERRAKTELSNKQLAAKLEVTENYLCALENARAFPSLKVFFAYLLAAGFDCDPLSSLEIRYSDNGRKLNRHRTELIQKVFTLSDEQIRLLHEQMRTVESSPVRKKA